MVDAQTSTRSGPGVGLIGSGFMGRAHAFAFGAVAQAFGLERRPVLEMLADGTEASAERAAAALGFRRATADWESLVADPAVDVVSITTPNRLHAPMALAAIRNGKHVWCEKPLSATLEEAIAMTRAAEAAGVSTMVGFNYLKNPMVEIAREIVRSGEIGEITGYRGIHAEDFMADPEAPFSWRCRPEEAGGALADIGSHAVAMARFLLGEVDRVFASLDTIHTARPLPDGGSAPVHVDDQASMLLRFRDRPFTAIVSNSWLASGRDMQLAFEISGTKGALVFTQERFNELRYYRVGGDGARKGFTTINAGPAHGEYGAFCPAGGHQIGFNDLKTIEAKKLLDAMAAGRDAETGFRDALSVLRVTEAARLSSAEERWVRMDEIADA